MGIFLALFLLCFSAIPLPQTQKVCPHITPLLYCNFKEKHLTQGGKFTDYNKFILTTRSQSICLLGIFGQVRVAFRARRNIDANHF